MSKIISAGSSTSSWCQHINHMSNPLWFWYTICAETWSDNQCASSQHILPILCQLLTRIGRSIVCASINLVCTQLHKQTAGLSFYLMRSLANLPALGSPWMALQTSQYTKPLCALFFKLYWLPVQDGNDVTPVTTIPKDPFISPPGPSLTLVELVNVNTEW